MSDTVAELLRRQNALQAEARAVEADLQLLEVLGSVGAVNRVGSAALGLMVWRDLDLTVVTDQLALDPVLAVATRLAKHDCVRRVEFRNDTRSWNTDPGYPDGLYLGVEYRSATGEDWKLDVWFVDEPDRQPDLEHMRWMPGRLSQETREAILLIKSTCLERGNYGQTVRSFDVYSAVLTDSVRTPEEFDLWLTERHLRGRV